MRLKIIGLVLVGVLCQRTVSAQSVGRGALISVAASASVTLEATEVRIPIHVAAESDRPDSAAFAMSAIVDSVTAALLAAGIPREAVRGLNFRLNARFRPGEPPQPKYYSAEVVVDVTTSDLDQVSLLVTRALLAGATGFGHIQYDSSHRKEAEDRALEAAVRIAREKATIMAAAGGGRLGRLVEISNMKDSNFSGGLNEIVVEYERPLMSSDAFSPETVGVMATAYVTWEFESANE